EWEYRKTSRWNASDGQTAPPKPQHRRAFWIALQAFHQASPARTSTPTKNSLVVRKKAGQSRPALPSFYHLPAFSRGLLAPRMCMTPFPILALLVFIEVRPLAVGLASLCPILLIGARFVGVPAMIIVVFGVVVAHASRATRSDHGKDHCRGK